MVEQESRIPEMTLYSGQLCLFSHCCRIVLLEKDIQCNVEYTDSSVNQSSLYNHNPYGETPTLLDRDLVLYDSNLIVEYLDERFPHPPLMPVDPISRAKTRLMIMHLRRDLLIPINALSANEMHDLPADLATKVIDSMVSLSHLLEDQPFPTGNDYTMVDAYLAPLLWRLPTFGIKLPDQSSALDRYAKRLFTRPSFRASLSPHEDALR